MMLPAFCLCSTVRSGEDNGQVDLEMKSLEKK